MSILSQDLITQIHFLLPVKSLLRFCCVSKSWLALISDPYFIKMQIETNTERSLIVEMETCDRKRCNRKPSHCPKDYYWVDFSNDYRFGEPMKIFPPFYSPENLITTSLVGFCNGLICIRNNDYEFVIWNSLIKKYKKLPLEPVHDKHKRLNSVAAFGYDPVNDDYKVLWIVLVQFLNSDDDNDDNDDYNDWVLEALEIMVYSLKAHSWRRVKDQWPYKEESRIFWGPAFLNGAFHWLVHNATGARTLLAFDLTTEKFEVQTFPFQWYSDIGLEVLGGSLCVFEYTDNIEVWIMKEYGVASSWSPLYSLPNDVCSPVFSEDGKKVLMEYCFFRKKFFWYDIKKKTRRVVENYQPISNRYLTGTWMGTRSLLLLDGYSGN